MNWVHRLELKSRIDEYSYQVSATNDHRFWVRLVREPGRDVITDYIIGSVPEASAAEALIECYHHLNLKPQGVLLFRDILPGITSIGEDQEARARALDDARQLFTRCGRAVLSCFGVSNASDRIEEYRGKYDVIVQSD